MFYKPKFCCNCSEKIEHSDRSWLPSSRFCQLCKTEFVPHEWIPRGIVLFGLIGIIFGFAGYFQKNEKPLKISSSSISGNLPARKDLLAQSSAASIEAKPDVKTLTQTAANSVEQKQTVPVTQAYVQKSQSEAADKQPNAVERVYFCGAMTKKGTACSRRVKGGGRCWQHAGQPPILPPEQLIASR
jgi:hypothetical protein